MGWTKKKSRYESEIHLGFLAIASLLVFLNFASNYVIFKARSTLSGETGETLRLAAVAASRDVQARYPAPLTEQELERTKEANRLAGLNLIPLKPADASDQARRDWFRAVLKIFPPAKFPRLADKLYNARTHELARGEGNEYYYLYPIPAGAGGSLLVLTVERPNLAYLDDSRHWLMVIFLGSLLVVGLVYLLLSRFIFRPFRRLKETAQQAGRTVSSNADETEAVIEEYEKVISQLTQAKTELTRLNKEVSLRADSLELFNRYLLDSSRSGVVTLDRDGRVAAVNDQAVSILGLRDKKATIGLPFQQLLDSHPELTGDIELAMRENEAWGYREYTGEPDESSNTPIGVTLTFIRDTYRETTGLLLLISDLTEESRLRRELESRKRLAALGEMAGGLAHQVRNSLGAIGGYGTLLKKRLKRDDLDTEPATQLLDETREAGELITKFLSFARPFEYSPEPIDLGRLVGDCLESYEVRTDCEKITVASNLTGGLEVQADPILFKQAVTNLVDNAIDAYGDDRGEVEVKVAAETDRACVVISDRGPGIPPEKVDQIFTPFYSSRPSGTGLGLPLVAKICDLHGGWISVDSVMGAGTRFTLSLPLARVPAAPERPEEIRSSI